MSDVEDTSDEAERRARSEAARFAQGADAEREAAEYARRSEELARAGQALSDQLRRERRGCGPRALALGAILAGLLASGFYLWQNTPDDDGAPSTQASAGGSTTSTSGEPETPTDEDDPYAAYAGTWVLASGLDSSRGADHGFGNLDSHDVTFGPSEATVVIARDGKVVGGVYRTSLTATGGPCPADPVAASSDYKAVGGQVGPDGGGLVDYRGTHTETQCGHTGSYEQGDGLYFWITGETMVACQAEMSSPTTCLSGEPIAATFRRTSPA
jgi:hypothetical protein